VIFSTPESKGMCGVPAMAGMTARPRIKACWDGSRTTTSKGLKMPDMFDELFGEHDRWDAELEDPVDDDEVYDDDPADWWDDEELA